MQAIWISQRGLEFRTLIFITFSIDGLRSLSRQRESSNQSFENTGVDFEKYLMPLPLELAGAKYAQIDVLDEEKNLLCSISSQDIVHANGFHVVCRPYDS